MKGKPTFAYWHDTNRAKKTGKYPVKLRVTFRRKRKYYGTGIDLSKEEWDKMHLPDVKGKLLKRRRELDQIVQEAEEVGSQMTSFSFHQFEDLFFNAPDDSLSVYDAYDRRIQILEQEEREGTRDNYEDSKVSLQKFKKNLSFYDVTPDFLNSYEKYMLEAGKSPATVGIYLRPLRAIMNQAIQDKVISNDSYPFRKDKYKIPTGKKGKVALNEEELSLLLNYKPVPFSNEDRSFDFWVFSYLCNGMNFKDIFNLRYYQIEDDHFTFKREKTRLTTKDAPIFVDVQLTDYSRKIIEKWGNKDRNPQNYVFPFVNTEKTEKSRKNARKQFIRLTNHYLKRICTKIGIQKEVTTYVARHTFAYIVITRGYSIEVLKELLGHSDIKTTQNYTNGIIPPKTKKAIANSLLDFTIEK
ncbi:site-specific integrase [Marinilabilia salmonicolor]|uniref:Site-specific recombinase XerD n=1 Tax=Marinilabilia salmonicolor TaxID=989 RepID=A0A368UT22_9BACT|nr:site-specific integrase [Marinilabilia salmonicolor]RCW31959.1 site-specific recombinase XerD [Marinilabilia salmonicolor]